MKTPRPAGSRRGMGKYAGLALLAIALIYGYWTTRDTCPVQRLIPADQTYYILANDLVARRDTLAESKIWRAIPANAGIPDVPRLLNQGIGVPEWIMNNLVPGACHVSGKDLRRFGDMLFVSRMTRIGCLLYRLHPFVPGIASDPAGGLCLSHAVEPNVYFAVRGRTLLASLSRNALIRALTLQPEDAIDKEAFARIVQEGGQADLQGTVAFRPQDPLGGILQSVRFAVRVEPTMATLKCRASFRPEWQSWLKPLVSGLGPRDLIAAPDGMLTVSMDFGKPLRELCLTIAEAAGQREAFERLWRDWAEQPPFQPMADLFGSLGPGIRLSWCGVDLNAIAPVPEIVATFDAKPDDALAVFASLPPLTDDARRYEVMHPQYNSETKRACLPLVGGPSIEPTAGVFGNAVLLSSSETVAEKLLTAGPKNEKLPQHANLLLAAHPRACFEAITSVATLLAENSLLKDYTPKSFQGAAEPWLTGANALREILALVAFDQGDLTAELTLVGS